MANVKGPREAKRIVLDALRARMPALLADAVEADDLNPLLAQPPVLWSTSRRPSVTVDEWPAIFVTAVGAPRPRTVQYAPGGLIVLERAYRVRIHVFARNPSPGETVDTADELDDFELTDLARDLLVAAATEALLADIRLGDDRSGPAAVIPSTIAESDGETLPTTAGRTIAASWLEVDVIVAERIPAVDRGAVQTVEVTTELLDHPAL